MAITVEQARERVLKRCGPLEHERVPLLEALGRVLAKDACSDIDIAPFDNSAMDGYAVRAANVIGASSDAPATLSVVSHIAAGEYSSVEVGEGQAARIMTGAPMPPGADTVVMVEYTEPGAEDAEVGGTVLVKREPSAGENVRRRGEEVKAGEVVVSAGEVVGPAGVGLLASSGHDMALVYRRPRVAVLSTGDELVDVTEAPGPGKIRNSNSYSLSAQVIAAGGLPYRYPVVRDDPDDTKKALLKAAAETDYIIASGGVSMGEHDYVRPVLEEIGELDFFKVAMRPGNPQTMGAVDGVPFFGLPGNPSSTFVGFEVFVRPALRLMQGHRLLFRPMSRAVLAHDVKKKPVRRYYLRGRVDLNEAGEISASLTGSQSSALLTAAHMGNCLLVLPEGEALFPAGSKVEVMRLDLDEGTPSPVT